MSVFDTHRSISCLEQHKIVCSESGRVPDFNFTITITIHINLNWYGSYINSHYYGREIHHCKVAPFLQQTFSAAGVQESAHKRNVWEDAIVRAKWISNWLPEGEMKERGLNYIKCFSHCGQKISQIASQVGQWWT